jgi:hypothetical protein
MLKLESEALEVIRMVPLAAPAAAGEKSAVNDVLWPAVNIKGKVRPLKLKPEPLATAAEMVRLVPPELVRIPLIDFELPSWTFPKLKLEGFETRSSLATLVPESATASVLLLALDLIVRVPVAGPVPEGSKVTAKLALCPTLSVTGRVGPVKLNPVPVTAALDTVTLSPPVFVTATETA